VSGRWPARVALAVWVAAGAACGVIDDSERLTDAQQVIADMKIGPSDQTGGELKIVGAVDHADRHYRVGEPIALSVQVNQAAYVAVLRVMPNGATTLVFPNRRQASAQVAANSPLRLPAAGDQLGIAAEKPGVALFEFVAATRGDSWLFNRKPQAAADFAELGATTRALAKDIVLSLRAGHGADTAASHLALRVRGE
jgi:Domain of unknown function (DUF4384)